MSVRALVSLATIIATAIITLPSSAISQTLPVREVRKVETVAKSQQQLRTQKQLASLSRSISRVQADTWSCQDKLQINRSRASQSPWALPQSVPYRRWVASRWTAEKASCELKMKERVIPSTNDWVTAVKLVQRIYPGTADWLLYISHREGGYGGFKMNYQGSGAGGWMQFMSSTYYAYSNTAFADAKNRGFIVDTKWNAWTHPMGQAITAGYMKYTGREGCHWCL